MSETLFLLAYLTSGLQQTETSSGNRKTELGYCLPATDSQRSLPALEELPRRGTRARRRRDQETRIGSIDVLTAGDNGPCVLTILSTAMCCGTHVLPQCDSWQVIHDSLQARAPPLGS